MTLGRRDALRVLGGAAAAPLFALPAFGQAEPLRVASSTADGFAQAAYADAAGFFKRAQLNVSLEILANSGAMIAAVAGGSMDIGLTNPISLANAVAQGIPVAAIAPSVLYTAAKPTAWLIVDKASPLKTARDLEGKTVGLIELRGITQTGMTEWLKTNGADPKAVHFLEIPFAAMGPAIPSRIDAGFISEPSFTRNLDHTRVLADPYEAVASAWYVSLWFAGTAWIAKHAAETKRFAQTIVQAGAWANAHHRETATVLQRVAGLPADVVAKMHRVEFAEHFDPALVQPILDAAARNNALKRPMTAQELIATI